jgi:hypothetical protein
VSHPDLSLDALTQRIDRARGHGQGHGTAKRRTVVRFDRRDVERLDALRARLGGASRAAVVRAFVLLVLDMVDAAAPATTEGGTP